MVLKARGGGKIGEARKKKIKGGIEGKERISQKEGTKYSLRLGFYTENKGVLGKLYILNVKFSSPFPHLSSQGAISQVYILHTVD